MSCVGRIPFSLKRICSLRINTPVHGGANLHHATSPLHRVFSSEDGEEAEPDSVIQNNLQTLLSRADQNHILNHNNKKDYLRILN